MQCQRCTWKWEARTANPRAYPYCKSPKWNVPRSTSPAQKTLQGKLGELPVDRKIKKLTDKKIAEAKSSKIESIERMAEEADRVGLYDKVLVPDSEISVQILDSADMSALAMARQRRDLPTVFEPKNLAYEPFED